MLEKDSERRAWARDQMKEAKVPDQYYSIVERLLDMYWPYAMQNEVSPEQAKQILSVFLELAQGHTLLPEDEEEVWIEGKPGNLVMRDVVRVRRDAYDGPAGLRHNGRRAVVTAIRNGDVHVRYTDEQQPEYARHLPYVFEKLVRR